MALYGRTSQHQPQYRSHIRDTDILATHPMDMTWALQFNKNSTRFEKMQLDVEVSPPALFIVLKTHLHHAKKSFFIAQYVRGKLIPSDCFSSHIQTDVKRCMSPMCIRTGGLKKEKEF